MTDFTEPGDIIIAKQESQPAPLLAFASIENFEKAQRMAKLLAASELVPTMYKGEKGIANCLIAMEVSARTGSSILAVVQNLHVINGRPSWSASYIIAAINSCGRFHPLSMPVDGEGDERGCQATTTVIRTGEMAEGPRVTIRMAKAQGWYSRKDRNGKETSKWPDMPDLMLRYRAASMFGRLYAPEILMGMQTDEESQDIAPPTVINPNTVEVIPQPDASNAPDGPEQNAAGEKPKKTRRKRRTPEEIEADKAAAQPPSANSAPEQAAPPEETPPQIQAPGDEPPPDEPHQAETGADAPNKPLF